MALTLRLKAARTAADGPDGLVIQREAVAMSGLSRMLSRRSETTVKSELHLALESLMTTVNEHDTYTGGHSVRVAELAKALARVMELDERLQDVLQSAGHMHDVGKIGIPDKILRKPGALTSEELHLIKLHPILGASILSRVPGCEQLVPIVLYHHERWDGRGYPKGLSGPAIPLEARLIFVADAFDAMTTERPYGEALAHDQAVEELRGSAGKQFDPTIVAAMTEVLDNNLIAQTITL